MHIYVDLISYDYKMKYLREEKLKGSDVIKKASEYQDWQETRMSINKELSKIAKNIYNPDYMEAANPNPSDDISKPGLSSYVNIKLKHPEGLSRSEINDFYKYSIRFSDHKDKHPKSIPIGVKVVGKRLDQLEKAAQDALEAKLDNIQKRVKDFELEKFGKQFTFITDSPTTESLKLRISD